MGINIFDYLISKGSGGGTIDGDLQSYVVASGQTISAGDFVSLLSTGEVAALTPGNQILGVSKKSGTSGETIKLFISKNGV